MGICASMDAAGATEATAKVILPDGGLREYDHAVTACDVLLKHQSTHFVCCADDMDLDGHLHAVPRGEELEVGQIYFVLPKSMLGRRIRPEEMAKLAVRASATINIGEDPYVSCRRRSGGGSEGERRRRARKAGSGRDRKFVAELSAIAE